jgi:hypothetical protein
MSRPVTYRALTIVCLVYLLLRVCGHVYGDHVALHELQRAIAADAAADAGEVDLR